MNLLQAVDRLSETSSFNILFSLLPTTFLSVEDTCNKISLAVSESFI